MLKHMTEDVQINSPYKIHWHLLRFVKQGRGQFNKDEALNETQMQEFKEIFLYLKTKYKNLDITRTRSFQEDRNCNNQKAVVTWQKEIIACSALKYMTEKYGSQFKCQNRI